MQKIEWQFPQYRKYRDTDTWYCIHDLESFTEIKRMGSRFLTHEVKATIYPEKLRILDMLECNDDLWISVSAQDFHEIESNIA